MQKKSSTQQPQVCVIILTWNNERDIEACLTSILQQDYTNYKVLVVDNASSDRTKAILHQKYTGRMELLAQDINQFFTGGNNRGFAYAIEKYDPEYLLILNPDTKVQENLISTLVSTAEQDNHIGAVGPKIVFWENANAGLINSAGLDYDGMLRAYDWGCMQQDQGQFDEQREVFGVTGTCILFRSQMIKEIGGFWEKLQMYLDEVELFIRAHKHNWKVVYQPATTVFHKYMQSTSQNKLIQVEKLKMRNWFFIAWRHYSWFKKLVVTVKFLLFKIKII